MYGQWFDENDVLVIVMMFSMINPELEKNHKYRNISAKETFKQKHMLNEKEMHC